MLGLFLGKGIAVVSVLGGAWSWWNRRRARVAVCCVGVAAALSASGPPGERAARWLLERPTAHDARFAQAMGIGGLLGRVGTVEMVVRLARLSPALTGTVLDGAAHELRLALPTPQAVDAHARQLGVTAFADTLHAANLRGLARDCAFSPACTLAAVSPWDGHPAEPMNAVRTALQHDLRARPAAALELALRYPEAWHPALVEELGWRAGNDGDDRGFDALGDLPDPQRCAWARGVARGELMHPGHQLGHEPLGDALAQAGLAAPVREGQAWGLVLRGPQRERAWRRAREHPDPAVASALAQLTQVVGQNRATLWAPVPGGAPCTAP